MDCRRYRFSAMGSPCVLHLHGDDDDATDAVADAAIAEIDRLERKYSRFREDSLLSRINRGAGDPTGLDLDDETCALIDHAATCWTLSDGLFDVTSGVLRQAWDFKSGRVPDRSAIEAARARVGFDKLVWARPRLALPLAGMEIDFGGIVKEFAADRVAGLCRTRGIRGGLVDLGGDLSIIGPHPDGTPWRIGIRHPRRPERALATVSMVGGAIASSGDYERCMQIDGQRYSHILDPRTGWPVAGLAGVSVAASHCVIAGAASTIAMLKGATEGPRWLDALGLLSRGMDPRGVVSGSLGRLVSEDPTRRATRSAPGSRCGSRVRRDPC